MTVIFSAQSESLPQRLADALRPEVLRIAREHPEGGGRLMTEKALLSRYHVSERTLREAIGLLVHDGLVERRRGSGMYTCSLREYQHVAILTGAALGYLPEQGFPLLVCRHAAAELGRCQRRSQWYMPVSIAEKPYQPSPPHEYPDLVENLRRGRVAGIVAMATNPHPDWLNLAREQQVPMAGGFGKQWNIQCILDYAGAIRRGVDYLVESGSTRLAMMGWWGDQSHSSVSAWQTMFRQALAHHGLACEPRWMRDDQHPRYPGAGWAQFREIWSADRVKPDGLLICDDFLYRDAATAIVEMGIDVPGQLRVATTANRGLPCFPPFPTAMLEFDPSELASMLCKHLIQQIEQGESKRVDGELSFEFRLEPGGVAAGQMNH